MIDFELTDEQQAIRDMLREFSANEIAPRARSQDEAGQIDSELMSAIWKLEIIQSQSEGGGRSPFLAAIVLEELAAGDASVATAVASTMAYSLAIVDYGTEEQKRRLTEVLKAPEFQASAIAVMEPSFACPAERMKTEAVDEGRRTYLRGTKSMVPLASGCRDFLVLARYKGQEAAFIVPRETRGVTVREPCQTVGLRALQLSEVVFDNVEIDPGMQLGGVDGCDTQKIRDGARTAQSCIMTGLSVAVMNHVVPYVKERVVHGAPLAQKQSVAFRVADMRIDTEAMRWMNWRSAWEIETGQSATRLAALACAFAGEKTMKIADEGLQMFGGHGFVCEHPLEMWYRNARAISVLEGVAGL
ncbi:acyl-CoA dehydrogenase domain-containing protein [Hyphomonas adhaerens MHS-3]|uniref:Acyl-CoA dehydrogenase domain-containing protein n=1 Tax=Hyphomonas adhaerens MHS-3 TaxID=1280949 RepID=A0A069E814_9PROT|nr:acyl-CoA dehydrogenase family protein [Hyphomonas adhaerens]KCZ86124.1 acyl-CoA dehydrogenase domain-containing protein [Hyphomonas adhaerens MHS-3]